MHYPGSVNLFKKIYDKNYLSFGITDTIIDGEKYPQYVIYFQILVSDSMKPNELKTHLEIKQRIY